MKYDPQKHHRRSIRLPGYDYTQPGAYFVTICSYQRAHVFGEIVDGEMKCNRWGEIVREEWFKTAVLRPYVRLREEEFVVMPNHAHGIVWIVEEDGKLHVGDALHNAQMNLAQRAEQRSAPTVVPGSLGAIIRGYKSAVTYAINGLMNVRGVVWQRNYYEHVVRNEIELTAIAKYIDANPFNWQLDRDNSRNIRNLPAPETIEEYLQDVDEMLKDGRI
ncbi:MAG: hypothetical protein QM730_21005 [Anaerolineales bacterium]